MAKDFRASQIETSKLILTGGIANTSAAGLIYSGSVSTDREGGIPATMLTNVGSDVFLFVSGTKSNSDFNRTDVTLFGGDIVVSGTVYAERQIIEVDGLVDGDLIVTGNFYVKPDANSTKSAEFRNDANQSLMTVDTTNGRVVVNEDNSTTFQFRVGGRLSHGDLFLVRPGTDSVSIDGGFADNTEVFSVAGNDQGGDTDTLFKVTPLEVTINPDDTNHVDFRVATDQKSNAIFTKATTNQVLILSGGAVASFDEASAPDVSFYVSGTAGSHGSSIRGTSVFGGDTYTSGSAYVNTLFVENEDPTIVFREPSSTIDKGTIGINNSDNIQIENKSTNKHIVFKVNDGGIVREGFRIDGGVAEVVVNQGAESLVDFRVESANKDHAIFVDGSTDSVLILSGGAASSPSESLYSDVNFFVSGAVGSAGSQVKGTSLFGGDVVISGSTHTQGAVRRNTRLKSSDFNVKSTDHFLFFNTNSGHVTASLESASAAGAGRVLVFKDVKGFADTNHIVIKPDGSDKIEGINDETKIKVASGSLSLVCDGASRYFVFGERD